MLSELATSQNHAIIMSTHGVEMVQTVCNRAMFLASGQIVQSWDRDGLRQASDAPGSFENCVIEALKTFQAVRVDA